MLILDARAESDRFVNAIDGIIRRSRHTALFAGAQKKRGFGATASAWPVSSLADFEQHHAHWRWDMRGHVLAGRMDNEKKTLVYDGPYATDSWVPEYAEQVTKLMKKFHWALFSHFTTYHDHFLVFLTAEAALAAFVTRETRGSCLLGNYRALPPLLPLLPNISFHDYGEEGWLPYELARERGEAPPLILTVKPEIPGNYRRFDPDTEELEDFLWFEEPMRRLELVREFSVYRVHRATDFDAYLALWAEASHNWSIAEATLSADCNLHKLERALRDDRHLDIIRDADALGSWAYGQIYGGGADEHHAVFHSRDASATHRIWEMAGESAFSRF